jgi:hypothetical protein
LNEISGRNLKQLGDVQEPPFAGQPLVLSMQHVIGFGAFSVVFRHPNSGTIFKLFRERDENNQLGDLGDHEPVLRRAAFDSEVAAYQIAMESDDIRPLVPTFHGSVVIDQVLGVDGMDISHQFLLECCYIIDFVEGAAPVKFTTAMANLHAHLQAAIVKFEANEIRYWYDGAVFHPAEPALTKIIDFALEDVYGKGAEAIALAE